MTDRWSQRHWAGVLDRIEHREVGLGLRFWGPPLWLEVTMVGPDSDRWSTAGAHDAPDQSWNWQSTDPCYEAEELVRAGAADVEVLAALSRYVFENLVLNAVHEIGEWLRFDARRPFSAHGADRVAGDGVQGNGAVCIKVDFAPSADVVDPGHAVPADLSIDDELSGRLAELAAAWRFNYLPGKRISYDAYGPTLVNSLDSRVTSRTIPGGAVWSKSTREAGSTAAFVEAVQRDVHQMLVYSEVQRICENFTVDGRRPWHMQPALDRRERMSTEMDGQPVSVRISYEDRQPRRVDDMSDGKVLLAG